MRAPTQLGILGLIVALVACSRSGYDEEAPALQLDQAAIRFTARVGQVIEPATVALTEANGLDQAWRASPGAGWLRATPNRGVGAASLQVSVDTRNLAPGVHTAELTVSPVTENPEAAGASLLVELTLEAPGWTAQGGPPGGEVTSLAVDPADPDRILLGTGWGGLFGSSDGGASFTRVDLAKQSGEGITAIAFGPGQRAYLGVGCRCSDGGGVYRSNDGGRTWLATSLQNSNVYSVGVDISDPELVLASVAHDSWISQDGGSTWALVPGIPDSEFVVPKPGSPGWFLVGGHGGALYETDGQSTTPMQTGVEEWLAGIALLSDGTWIVAEGACCGNSYTLHRSRDQGATWTPLPGDGLPAAWEASFSLFADGTTLWALHARVYRSDDGGQSFRQVPEGFSPAGNHKEGYQVAAAHPDGVLFGHKAHGVARFDGQDLTRLPLMAHIIPAIEVHASSGLVYMAVSTGGLYRLALDGVFTGLAGQGLSTAELANLSVDPRNPDHILVGTYWSEGGLYRTEDGGATWTNHLLGLPGDLSQVSSLGRAPDDPDAIWVAAEAQGLYFSSDGGRSFALVTGDTTTQVAPLPGGLAWTNTGGLAMHDRNAGTFSTVDPMNTPPSLLAAGPDGSLWYGHDHYPLHRSRDGGQTWTEVGFGNQHPRCLAVNPANPDHVLVGYPDGLFESRDGGQTWSDAGSPFPPRSVAFDPSGPGVWVGSHEGGLYRYLP